MFERDRAFVIIDKRIPEDIQIILFLRGFMSFILASMNAVINVANNINNNINNRNNNNDDNSNNQASLRQAFQYATARLKV